MINIHHQPSETPASSPAADNDPAQELPEFEESRTLIVPPPNLQERIRAAQRARTLQIEPTVEVSPEDKVSDG